MSDNFSNSLHHKRRVEGDVWDDSPFGGDHDFGNLGSDSRDSQGSDIADEGLVGKVFDDMTDAYESWLKSIPNAFTRDSYARVIRRFRMEYSKPLNRLTRDDIILFVQAHPSYHQRKKALAAVQSFIKYALKRAPNLSIINIGEKPEPPPIAEPSKAESKRLLEVVDKCPVVEKAALRLLIETGHRRRAIVELPREAIQMRPTGPVIVFPPRTQKRGTSPVAPITQATYDLLTQIIASHKDQSVFGPVIWRQRGKWLYLLVKRVGREAGLSVRAYPHLFRHLKALKCRREGVKEDTVINTLGWKDGTIYNSRYGRRQAFETAEEARALLGEPVKPPMPEPQPPAPHRPPAPRPSDDLEEVIKGLTSCLREGKMDLATYKATIAALTEKSDRAQNSNIQGYV